MVPRLDNDTINTRFQYDNNNMTPAEALIAILREHENIIHHERNDQIDVNAFGDDPASGIVTVANPQRTPILITDILATWSIPTAIGFNPLTLGATGVASFNNNPYTAGVTITGGTVSQIAVNGTNTNLISGTFFVPAGGTITVTYTVAPAISSFQVGPSIGSNAGNATLTFGGRTFQLQYSSGLFIANGMTHGLQLDNTAKGNAMTLTVSPAAAVHLEFAGTADYRKIERI